MNRLNMVVIVLSAASLVAACEPPTGLDSDGSSNKSKGITTSAQAQAAFAHLRASGAAVDRQIVAPFNGSRSVSGASVSGKKTTASNSTSSGASTSRQTDLQIEFAGFALNGGAVTGKMRWFDYYYSSTRCSSSSCASESDHSEAVEGTALKVQFVSSGETISDEITIDANSPDYTDRWTVKVTTRSGQVFSFSTY
jgi:hypothetical protein